MKCLSSRKRRVLTYLRRSSTATTEASWGPGTGMAIAYCRRTSSSRSYRDKTGIELLHMTFQGWFRSGKVKVVKTIPKQLPNQSSSLTELESETSHCRVIMFRVERFANKRAERTAVPQVARGCQVISWWGGRARCSTQPH